MSTYQPVVSVERITHCVYILACGHKRPAPLASKDWKHKVRCPSCKGAKKRAAPTPPEPKT